ncbi:pleckstrin homology domain-containing family A member 7 isoform X2 [Bufo gargarizans]|uniref:pleckstrin homology domain-containing family A member 7 isoform X2 n=1 Tax=Bufo gargarizans TaxID=30331 RepID=UPI001CF1E242|nr:pleckstrin homology domain-containing family A member 7 isoform X2 [Bufo gargarizans]
MAAEGGGRESLPEDWSYGVCADGRVFFIDDRSRSTTWLHPRTGEPVNSGHMIRSDLPRGWEEGFTDEGASFFINHNQQATSFRHPVTGEISPENAEFDLRGEDSSIISPQQINQRPYSMVSEGSTAVTTSTAESRPPPKASKTVGKAYSFGKRDQSVKRNPSMPVLARGWLHKQDSSGMKMWKRRWFLLSDRCLFYYKDSREEAVLGSIPLLSYVIRPTGPEDRTNRKFSFKAVHSGMRAYIKQTGTLQDHPSMRTYYFSADTQEDMSGWIRVMNQAAAVQSAPDSRREVVDMEWPAAPVNDHTEYAKSEGIQTRSGYPKAEELRRNSAEERPHTDLGDKGRHQDVSEADKERRRKGGDKGQPLDLTEKERYRIVEDQERFHDTRTRESYITHKNTLNSNGGKFTLSNGRHSAFTDFSKSYRPQVSQTPQPENIERNGTLPPSFRVSTGPLEQNGTDTFTRRAPANPEKQVQRKSMMGQVEQWVKVQKGEGKSVGPELPLSERYQTLPKTMRQSSGGSPPPSRHLPSDYKYAQDRVSHLKMSNQERQATKEGMVWQLYEWQQRQQFKHGSPTGQIYMGALEERSRAKSLLDFPRCVSVPPSPSDIQPPAPPKVFPPRRPHTPAERLSVRPEEGSVDVPYIGSPQKVRVHAMKSSAHTDRRSMGYMTHTADDTYLQLKKELEYLDLKIKYNEPLINLVHSVLRNSTPGYRTSINVTGRESFRDRSTKPVRIAESEVDAKLSVLCEQDRILQDLEDKIRALKDNKDKLETVLEVLHRQMDQYKDQPQHMEKISYQQRLLQEDLVQIRAEMSKVSTDMENSWNEYLRLEGDVVQLRQLLQEPMTRSPSSQDRSQLQKDLWRIEDVTAGLSTNKLNFKLLVESFKNPERKTVPLVSSTFVPSGTTAFTSVRSKSPQNPASLVKPTLEVGLYPQPFIPGRSYSQPQLLQKPEPRLQSPTRAPTPPKFEESAPPRPPLPDLYSPEDADPAPNIPPPPALPPPPRDSSVIRHTSVRGLKRQSDERKRDRELGQGVNGDYRVELRTYVSDPELANLGDADTSTSAFLASDSGYQTLPGRGFSGSTSRLPQSSSVASYVTLRRGVTADAAKDRPKSAFERLYAGDNQRGKMSAEEQLERMKRHQKALVRERKRTLSQGEKQLAPSRGAVRPLSADLSSWRREQDFDFQLLEKAARDVEEREKEDHGWVHAKAIHVTELDLEPQDYDLDIGKELSMPDKVEIPERYIDLEPEEPLSREEQEARSRRVAKIKNILARSSVHNLQPLGPPEDSPPSHVNMQEQERMITISYALASEASQRSKQVAAHAVYDH